VPPAKKKTSGNTKAGVEKKKRMKGQPPLLGVSEGLICPAGRGTKRTMGKKQKPGNKTKKPS